MTEKGAIEKKLSTMLVNAVRSMQHRLSTVEAKAGIITDPLEAEIEETMVKNESKADEFDKLVNTEIEARDARIKELSENSDKLGKEILALKDVVTKLTAERDSIQKDLSETKVKLDAGEKDVTTKAEEIKTLSAAAEASKVQIAQLADAQKKIQELSDKLAGSDKISESQAPPVKQELSKRDIYAGYVVPFLKSQRK